MLETGQGAMQQATATESRHVPGDRRSQKPHVHNDNCNMAANQHTNNLDCLFLTEIHFGREKKEIMSWHDKM